MPLFGKKKANTEEEKDTEKNIEEKLQKILKKVKNNNPNVPKKMK